ncbi:Uncharacterised protein [Mycobacterium tuberculosis]|uniref:Uncharacterized protein n=1 Tax=Mycobacterium tuberculosis TaxID=1773 RepID=A0A654U6Y2_MYCTX|nr:Uncharacterised protein [Mycobacterium tuberculosis]CKV43792.1 Uncharacterised protein [Mycobacterium tuberculosis]COZ59495.1 Uncharacterised protein [Mycobacterium tuberculosis]
MGGQRSNPVGHIRVVGPHPTRVGCDQQCIPEVGRQIDQCPVQRIARGPRLPGFLPSFKILHRAGGTTQRRAGAFTGTSGSQRRPQFFGLGLDTLRGQR